MRLHSINFQIQAMVMTVTIGSIVVFALLFKIIREFSQETRQLSKAVELSSVLEEWDAEMGIGVRSRTIYMTMRKEMYLENYQRSMMRIKGLSNQVEDLAFSLGSPIQDSLTVLMELEENYQKLASVIGTKDEKKKLKEEMKVLKDEEKALREAIEHFLQEILVNFRNLKLRSIEKTINSSKNLVFSMALAFIFVNIVIWLSMRRKILSPLKVLEKGAKRIGEGELGLQVQVNTKGEIRDLMEVLNKMSIQLKKNQAAEAMLHKLETLSQVAASVNHEINNPLQIIMGNAEYLNRLMSSKNGALQEKNEVVMKKLKSILAEVHRISEVTQELKEIKNPVIDTYIGDDSTMIDIKRSS